MAKAGDGEPIEVPAAVTPQLAQECSAHVNCVVARCCASLQYADRQDIAQEALQLLLLKTRVRGLPAEPRAWLVGVVRNLRARCLRRRWRARGIAELNEEDDDVDGQSPLATPVAREDAWVSLEALLADVRPALRDDEIAALLALGAGESRKQIAGACGRSEDALGRRLRRSLETLRFYLGSEEEK